MPETSVLIREDDMINRHVTVSEDKIRLPNSRQRIAVIGRTGTGKTIAGLWHLSNARFDKMPWVIVDFKTDEHIAGIERAITIDVNDNPKQPGIYIIQPHPDDDLFGEFLERIWMRGNTGIFIDEGYMMRTNDLVEKRFVYLLTQGRSKRIPMIVVTQKPVWISRFVFSESDFFQAFHLNDSRDHKTVESFLPSGSIIPLPDYHSAYFDVSHNKLSYLLPVPDEDTVLVKIDEKLRPLRKHI